MTQCKIIRDYQRSAVYKWENKHIHSKDKTVVPYDQLQGLVNYIWGEEGLEYPPQIKPLPKQCSNKKASGSRLRIRAPEEGLKTTILIHEIAHSMTSNFEGESSAHNPRFVGVYINLLSRYARFNLLELMYTAKEEGVEFNFKGKIL